jgi:hypothetical protein
MNYTEAKNFYESNEHDLCFGRVPGTSALPYLRHIRSRGMQAFVIRYSYTQLITFYENGVIRLDTTGRFGNGRRTKVALKVFKKFLPLGLEVFEDSIGVWQVMLNQRLDTIKPYFDSMLIGQELV